ncbi:D-glycero-beta-D-manno-heptose 1-phosphate adenylyltransferase [Pacificibacter marinus]|uniref:D-glycero-beta-D-manno-heptose 1-phosphate adenylyltransferase n=1 Tax=Pacificibacter marinus TaxID=658057 RepID=UPI001C0681CC|nr:D-glycero-beta-D-manno-heptose 1-phosphate adenylyltransferase [Pacificibacter marinus]MBU2867479.1 D-glycero-beta-D-manno-heptose 1-phosphate adenylyltransferase [Pacificibacter marinus]
MTNFPFAASFGDNVVVCVGDVMLDHFYYGEALRISPEAPVPVLKINDRESMPGGAANTAMNIGSLGSQVRLIAPVGDDEAGRDLRVAVGQKFDVQLTGPVDPRGTIVKSRYSAQGQQLLRIDQEDTSSLPAESVAAILEEALRHAQDANLLVLSDYAKGVLDLELCQGLISWARENDIPCVVDPKGSDYSKYRGATILTPNELELSVVAGRRSADEEDIIADAMALIAEHDLTYLAVTRGKMGVMLVGREGLLEHVPSFARDVFDVSGAGDSFVAGMACAIASGQTIGKAIHYGNTVAGVAVGKLGTAMVSRDEVEKLILERGRTDQAVVTSDYNELAQVMKAWQDEGLSVGMTNGVFDLLHLGHLRILKESKAECDRLVVAINSDRSVKRLKGETRPIQPQELRAEVLSSMQNVDMVVIFDEDTPQELITKATPDLLVKGGDYVAEDIVGYPEVVALGGKVIIVPTLHGYSTTSTIQRMNTNDG